MAEDGALNGDHVARRREGCITGVAAEAGHGAARAVALHRRPVCLRVPAQMEQDPADCRCCETSASSAHHLAHLLELRRTGHHSVFDRMKLRDPCREL